jgi:hypothetical protein
MKRFNSKQELVDYVGSDNELGIQYHEYKYPIFVQFCNHDNYPEKAIYFVWDMDNIKELKNLLSSVSP